MHGFFLYTVLSFNGSSAGLRAQSRKTGTTVSLFPSLWIISFERSSFFPLSFYSFRFASRFFLLPNAASRSFSPDTPVLRPVSFRLFFYPWSQALTSLSVSLSSALLFSALVGKPSGPFAWRWRARPGGI